MVDWAPHSMPCERFGCSAKHNFWGFLKEVIAQRSTEGHVFLPCSATQKMNRRYSRQCLASQRGTYTIQYNSQEETVVGGGAVGSTSKIL